MPTSAPARRKSRLPRATRFTAAAVLGAIVLVAAPPAGAATAIDLGTADSFAVRAGTGITNTGATTITGDVGTSPTASMTGFESVVLTGVNHGNDDVADQAKLDLTTAYNQAVASRLRPPSPPSWAGGR